MKKFRIVLSFVFVLITLPLDTFAVSGILPPLNKVSFQLSAEEWATSTTAKVVVSINATLNDDQLGTIYGQIMDNLQKIANKVDWHITEFSRSKDQSGLEQLYAQAEARIPENQLTALRKNATDISKPGATYSISVINFSPSQAEIQAVKMHLRQKIYNEVQGELQRLSKVYPTQKFQPYSINFSDAENIVPMAQARSMVMVAGTNTSASDSAPLSVSDKVILRADVVLAASYDLQ